MWRSEKLLNELLYRSSKEMTNSKAGKIIFVRHLKSEANAQAERLKGLGHIVSKTFIPDPNILLCEQPNSCEVKYKLCELLSQTSMFVCSPLRRTWQTFYTLYILSCGSSDLPGFYISNALQEVSLLPDVSNRPESTGVSVNKFKKWVNKCFVTPNLRAQISESDFNELQQDKKIWKILPDFDELSDYQTKDDIGRLIMHLINVAGTGKNVFVFGHGNLFQEKLGKKFKNGQYIVFESSNFTEENAETIMDKLKESATEPSDSFIECQPQVV